MPIIGAGSVMRRGFGDAGTDAGAGVAGRFEGRGAGPQKEVALRAWTVVVAGTLVLGSVSGASAQDAAEERRSGWYAGGGFGGVWSSSLVQNGWNRDPLCYPTNACFDEEPRPEISGYRWRYDVAAASGFAFELSTGVLVDRARLELSFGGTRSGLDQTFVSVTDYDGVLMEDRRDSTVVSDTRSSIDHLSVRTLAFNAYYDFPAGSRFSPYVGAGLGPAFARVAGVRFSDEYRDTAADGDVHVPPLSSYNARLDDDLSATVPAWHLHAGADFRVAGATALGAKLTWSMLADIETSGGYDLHAAHAVDPDFSHHDTFSGACFWTLLFTVKHVFD